MTDYLLLFVGTVLVNNFVLVKFLGLCPSRGYSVEYFVEGGRSRTGRLLDPKTGTLSMTIQAMLRGGTRPITLIPIYIGYEHVMEVGTYAKELRGATKEKESLPQMLRGLSKLRNLGQGYVNFGEPMPLMTYLNQHVPDWRESIDPIEAVRPAWLTPTVNNIAADLMVRINNAGAANAMNLCCTALLASRQRSLTREQLTEQLNCYLDLMRNVPYSTDSTVPSASASELIDHALQMNKFEVEKDTIGDIIILPRRIAGPVQIRFHRRGVEIGAILEFNAFPQFHGVSHAVIGNGITLQAHRANADDRRNVFRPAPTGERQQDEANQWQNNG